MKKIIKGKLVYYRRSWYIRDFTIEEKTGQFNGRLMPLREQVAPFEDDQVKITIETEE